LSRHNITGSEAFKRGPFILIRKLPPGGRRRRRLRVMVAFVAGLGVATVAGLTAAAMVFGPGLAAG
jgi:hypothetical protein